MKQERRYIKVMELRVNPSEDEQSGGIGKLEGYAAVFNKLSGDLGFFREKIAPGAFSSALKKSDCRALVNHDSVKILGRQSAGTLRLKEDDKGLFMSVDLPDTQYARDLKVCVCRGDITQQSFGFTVKKDAWEEDREKKEVTRTIIEVDELFDVSPVTFPAYSETSVNEVRAVFDAAVSDKKIAGRGNKEKTGRCLGRIEHELKVKEKIIEL
jgi:HK97 family phage prohead protease